MPVAAYYFAVAQAKVAIVVFVVGLFSLLGVWLALDDKCDDCDNLTIAAEQAQSPTTEEVDRPRADHLAEDGLIRVDNTALDGTDQAQSDSDTNPDSATASEDSGANAEAFIDDIGASRNNGEVDLLVDPQSATTSTSTPQSQQPSEEDSGGESTDPEDEETLDGEGGRPTTTDDPDAPTDGETGGGENGGSENGGGTDTEPNGDPGGETATTVDPYPATVDGPDIFVDPVSGSNDQAGSSQATAFESFQRALDVVKPGQTIRLMTGEYREARAPGELHYYLGRSGRANAWVRITAAAGHRPEIVATSGTALFINADYVEVSGLIIRGEGFSQDNSWGVGISVPNVHHVQIVGNRISGMPAGGISVVGSSNYQILNNTLYENALWSDVAGSGISIFEAKDHGFGPDVGKYHDLIVGNRVFRNENRVPSKWQNHQILTDGNGIIIDSSKASGYGNWTLVANNLAVDNGSRGIIVWESSRVDIMFNTTFHNARTTNMGGRVEIAAGRSTDVHLAHNVAWARPGIRAAVFTDDPSVTSKGNVFITTNTASNGTSADTVYSVESPADLLVNPSTSIGSADFRPTADGAMTGQTSGSWSGPLTKDGSGTARGATTEPGAFVVQAVRGN